MFEEYIEHIVQAYKNSDEPLKNIIGCLDMYTDVLMAYSKIYTKSIGELYADRIILKVQKFAVGYSDPFISKEVLMENFRATLTYICELSQSYKKHENSMFNLAETFNEMIGRSPIVIIEACKNLLPEEPHSRAIGTAILDMYHGINIHPDWVMKDALVRLQIRTSQKKYYSHPLSGMICPISAPYLKSKRTLKEVNRILGVKNAAEHAILLACSVHFESPIYQNDEWISIKDVEESVNFSEDADKVWHYVGGLCFISHLPKSLKWLIEKGYVYCCSAEKPSLLRDMVINEGDKTLIKHIFDCFHDCKDGDILNRLIESDSHGKTIIEYFINHSDEDFSLPMVKVLVERFCELDNISCSCASPCSKCHNLMSIARTAKKKKILKFLEKHKEVLKSHEKISKLFFAKKHGIKNVAILVAHLLNEFDPGKDDERDFVTIFATVDPGPEQEKIFREETQKLASVLQESGIPFVLNEAKSRFYVRYSTLKAVCFEKKPKKKVHREPLAVPEVETANIQAHGGGGGQRERKPKPLPVREEIASKFTEIERNAMYLRIQMEKCSRLHDACTIRCVFSELPPVRVTISEFKLHVSRMLGSLYTDELAHYFFTLHHYDPKTAIPAERSICSSIHSEFKGRNESKPVHTLEELEEVELVELRPRKFSDEKKVTLPDSIHLKAAVHEFLFLKGVFSWHQSLSWPMDIHMSILNDCMRLCATRFYNAMMLYNREGGESISINDAECRHLRNIMVHNHDIPHLREHVEKILFPYGEKILSYMKEGKIQGGLIILRDCSLYSLAVQDDISIPGHVCRSAITKLLERANAYLTLLGTKVAFDGSSALLNCLNRDWYNIADDLKIWVHHARAIESCILQVGQLSRAGPKFLRKDIQEYVSLCREVRHVGHHQNLEDGDWNFDPVNPSFLADMIKGMPKM